MSWECAQCEIYNEDAAEKCNVCDYSKEQSSELRRESAPKINTSPSLKINLGKARRPLTRGEIEEKEKSILSPGSEYEKRVKTTFPTKIAVFLTVILTAISGIYVYFTSGAVPANNGVPSSSASYQPNKSVSTPTLSYSTPASNIAAETPEDESFSDYTYLIGSQGVLKNNVNFRSGPTPKAKASIIGVHYKGTKIEILEVRENIVSDNYPSGINWYRVKVITQASCDYYYSPSGFCESDMTSKPTFGWINSDTVEPY